MVSELPHWSANVDGHLSDSLPVSIGVPQVSILGPLLFLLFLNDLPTISQSCKTTMYADNTECESASKPEDYKEVETTINNDLYRVKEYFDTNKLSLNIPKCEFMLVGTYQSLAKVPDIRIHINNEPLIRGTVNVFDRTKNPVFLIKKSCLYSKKNKQQKKPQKTMNF